MMKNFRYYRVSLRARVNVFDVIFALIVISVMLGIGYDMIRRIKRRIASSHFDRIDWHDWKLMEEEKLRTGPGEHGEPAYLPFYPEHTKIINETVGYNGYLSDKIALNRSLKDLRPPGCITEKYSSGLPSVSVVIIFHNEHLNTLLRTCYSVWNRTPATLLKEIILVDDVSTIPGLSTDLKVYIDKHMPIVKVIKLDKRNGLIKARIIGAQAAQGDVLVFLDSHCEAYHNWLPPLLDPIVNDYRTVVCPTIDMVSSETFEQSRQGFQSTYAGRGAFDWNFDYKLLPLLETSVKHPSKPFVNPVMAGGLFAINAKFFWELGAYDSGLETYGGEQYELSFKIWQCHGKMLENACSRITHIYRNRKSVNTHLSGDFLNRNYKRVAEVWMDEYKEYIYQRKYAYSNIDVGDISEQRALRERLHCKPFKWFMEHVAFDLLDHYPLLVESSFAYGGIKNLGTGLCVDTMSNTNDAPLGFYSCAANISSPHQTQTFSLTLDYDIRQRFQTRCWSKPDAQKFIWLVECSKIFKPEKELWRYDFKQKWIINKRDNLCLAASDNELILSKCNAVNLNMKWEFGNINITAYQNNHWYNDWDID